MKRRVFRRSSGLLCCARNDGERTAEISPRHCEELLRRSNPGATETEPAMSCCLTGGLSSRWTLESSVCPRKIWSSCTTGMHLRKDVLIAPRGRPLAGSERWPDVALADRSSPSDDRPRNPLVPFGSASPRWPLRAHLVLGYPGRAHTLRRSVSVRSVSGSVPRYRNGGFVESRNTYNRRPACVGRQTPCRTERSARFAHPGMRRYGRPSRSILQSLGGAARATTERRATLRRRGRSRSTRSKQLWARL
jgi:hypothetical protein